MEEDSNRGPSTELPSELANLLKASGDTQTERAWKSFLSAFHKLVLYAIRSTEKDHDAVMDCYAHVLEQLRMDDFRRLRVFAVGGKAKFSTWLVVVTHRLVLDHRRKVYGRERETANPGAASARLDARRRLAHLVASAVDVSQLDDPGALDPGRNLRINETRGALQAVLAELTGRDQLLLSLRFQDDKPAREIAEIMGFPSPFHVYRRLKTLLSQLRVELQSRGIDDAEF